MVDRVRQLENRIDAQLKYYCDNKGPGEYKRVKTPSDLLGKFLVLASRTPQNLENLYKLFVEYILNFFYDYICHKEYYETNKERDVMLFLEEIAGIFKDLINNQGIDSDFVGIFINILRVLFTSRRRYIRNPLLVDAYEYYFEGN